MNKLLSEVLEDISQEYSISNEIISPIVTKLSSQFYIKLGDFKNLSEQKWSQYQLPDNLYYLIKDKYDSVTQKHNFTTNRIDFEILSDKIASNKNSQETNVKASNNNTNETNKNNNNHNEDEVNYNDNINDDNKEKETTNNEERKNKKTNEPQLTSEEIKEALTNIDNEIENINTRSDAIGLIEGVLINIMENPKKEKYRKINAEKIKIRFPYDSVIKFFSLCKFTKDNNNNDLLHYSKPSEWLRNILPTIYGHYEIVYDPKNKDQKNKLKNSLRESLYKPYESTKNEQTKTTTKSKHKTKHSSKVKSNYSENEEHKKSENEEHKESENEKHKESDSEDSEDNEEKEKKLKQAYQEEKTRQKNIINNAVIIRLPKCYFLTNQNNFKAFQNMKNIHKYVPKQKDKELLESQQQLIKENKNKSTKDICDKFEQLLNQQIITAGDFYFHFPDNYIIKGTFSLIETVTDLYNFVREYILNSNEQFDLLYGNHKYQLTENETQLKKYKFDFTSPIMLEVSFPEQYCKLKESQINKMKLNFI